MNKIVSDIARIMGSDQSGLTASSKDDLGFAWGAASLFATGHRLWHAVHGAYFTGQITMDAQMGGGTQTMFGHRG